MDAALQQQLITATVAEVMKVLEAQRSASSPHTNLGDTDIGDDTEIISGWEDVIASQKKACANADAKLLIDKLATPPSLTDLRRVENMVTMYAGVPATPTARKHRVDANLWQVQHKLELVLNLLVHYLESGDRSAIGAAAAWSRSAFEDTMQQRRQLLAGRQSYKLEKRPDDNRPRLLSEEEEKKINKPSAMAFSWAQNQQKEQPFQQSARPSERYQRRCPRGKGKGKGKSRSTTTQSKK